MKYSDRAKVYGMVTAVVVGFWVFCLILFLLGVILLGLPGMQNIDYGKYFFEGVTEWHSVYSISLLMKSFVLWSLKIAGVLWILALIDISIKMKTFLDRKDMTEEFDKRSAGVVINYLKRHVSALRLQMDKLEEGKSKEICEKNIMDKVKEANADLESYLIQFRHRM